MPVRGSSPRSRIPYRAAWWHWILGKTFVYDALIALFVCLGGLANALRASHAGEYFPASLWFITAAGGLVFTIARIVVLILDAKSSESVHELLGCLHVLHSAIVGLGIGETRLRLTIHVPDAKPDRLQQIIDYVGEEPLEQQSKVGRTMPVHVGIVGMAFRTRQFVIADRQNEDRDQFVAELVKNWSFTEEGARELDQESRCWMAVPIKLTDESSVQGVLYADATVARFFTEERAKLMFAACAGIATYVARRYK